MSDNNHVGSVRDDGTMDTVIACDTCGEEQRYTFCRQSNDDPSYDEFIEECLDDFDESHECEDAEEDA